MSGALDCGLDGRRFCDRRWHSVLDGRGKVMPLAPRASSGLPVGCHSEARESRWWWAIAGRFNGYFLFRCIIDRALWLGKGGSIVSWGLARFLRVRF
jgi:hypothetical protein